MADNLPASVNISPRRLDVPFNVSILQLSEANIRGLKPVRSLDIFDGKQNYHEDGLFSVSIFGKSGDINRSRRFSYIDIKAPIYHPAIFKAIIALKALYGEIISGTGYAVWNDEICDFERSDQINGNTGYYFFDKYWKQIKFKQTNSVERQQNILLIEKYKNNCMLDKIVVMPAGLRDIEIDNSGRVKKDEINNYYAKLLSISNTINTTILNNNTESLNLARNNMGRTYNELYETISSMIKGKKKLLLNKWASRRVFNGTRNVISAMDVTTEYLGQDGSIGFNDTVVGLYQALKVIMPIARYHIRNGFLSNVFTTVGAPVKLVDMQTNKMVMVTLPTKYYDYWLTDDGIEKIITSFSDINLRDKPIIINGYYLALIYKGPDNTFKIIQDIDDIPETRNKLDVHPITFSEFLYISCYRIINKYPIMVTRYPITGIGSIYPSYIHVKTTVKSEKRVELDDSWLEMGKEYTAYEFPVTGSSYINTMSPHPAKIGRLGADYDR